MRYAGSKARLMKHLLPFLTEHLVDENTPFIDAFCGGANVVAKIPCKNKMGIELNKYVCALWQHIQKHGMEGIPESVTEEQYYDIKDDYINKGGKYPDWLIGYVGNCCSYGSAWFNGYSGFNPNKNEDHIAEAYRGLKKQVDDFINLKETAFINASCMDIAFFPKGSVIYCDPPYADTKKYESDFDHARFWDWVRNLSKNGMYVYVSEYNAPDDFKCIWQMKRKDGMATTKKGKKQNDKIEKLFVYGG